jgi:hypothetical protein
VFKNLSLLCLLLLLSACDSHIENTNHEQEYKSEPLCLSHQTPCIINTELGNFTVKFSQVSIAETTENRIKTELPFKIHLDFEPSNEKNLTKLSAHLEGKDMFMGKIPVLFNSVIILPDLDKATEAVKVGNNVSFVAKSLLASCSEDIMVWRLWITAVVGDEEQSFFIDFDSLRL